MTPALTRREFLKLAGAGASALALSGCGALSSREDLPSPSRTGGSGRVREYAFEAAPVELELDGRALSTWGYDGGAPGPELRLTEGDTLRVRLENRYRPTRPSTGTACRSSTRWTASRTSPSRP